MKAKAKTKDKYLPSYRRYEGSEPYQIKAKKIYRGSRWKNYVRPTYLESVDYLCERCSDIAKVVHHKIYLNNDNIDDEEIVYGFDNLEALCQSCHNREHHYTSTGYSNEIVVDDKGNIYQSEQSKYKELALNKLFNSIKF